jgi:hypothetical protein
MDTENNTEKRGVDTEKRGVGRPAKDVERFTTTLDRETLAWAKARFGERGVGPWITAKLQEERERIEAAEALAEKRARSNQ